MRCTQQQKQRFAEREKQMQLADRRGEFHMGSEVVEQLYEKREEKTRRLKALKPQD